jgi:transposase
MAIHGIGPAGAARSLGDVGDVSSFPGCNRIASWTGTAPIDASSGAHARHRLSRAGNRRLNHVLHIAAEVQLQVPRRPPPAPRCDVRSLDLAPIARLDRNGGW